MELYNYQKQAVAGLAAGKHLCVSGTGSGKTLIGLTWAKQTGKRKVLVCTTAGVRDAKSYEQEAEVWYREWYTSLSSFSVISWTKLADWTHANWNSLDDWAIIYDEVDSVCAGISSQRGKAFLQIARQTECWTGYTATPYENWEQAYPYFVACGKIRNKTAFYNQYIIRQQYPFPKTLGYRNEEQLQEWWGDISLTVDSSEVMAELPPEIHKVITFKTAKGYKQCAKTSTRLDGEFLDNASAYRHYLRSLCCSKEKMQWLADHIKHLDGPVLVLYNYNAELETLDTTIAKALHKGAKIWHINGAEHDIPTAETIDKHDVVLVQWASGSRGLNFQFINYWVSITPHDSYKVSQQGRGRIRRVGQTQPQFYWYLKCEGTVDEKVYESLKKKGDFAGENWSREQQKKYKFNWIEEKKNEG